MPRTPKPAPALKRRAPGTGSVVSRSDGRLAVVLPADLDPSRRARYGPGRRRAFTDREQAEAWLDAEIARLRAPPATARTDEPLGSYLARWYDLHEAEWPERTRTAYALSLGRWASIGGVRLGALTREVVQGAVSSLRQATWQRRRRDGTPTTEARPYSRRTLQHARTVLHLALDDLIPDVLAYNPARGRQRSRRAPDPAQPVWSADQAARFLDVAERTEPRVALAFRLILRRALRIGEVVALTWSDVDERGGTLTIDETAGPRRGTAGPTKTRRVRDVPLSADLTARLQAHRQRYPATDPHVFTIDGRPISVGGLREFWHRVIRVARVPTIAPKDGRATCATLLLDAGWPLPRVAQLLGHSSIATTAAFYARVLSRREAELTQMGDDLDQLLDRAETDAQEA